jgi:hypothetical protein
MSGVGWGGEGAITFKYTLNRYEGVQKGIDIYTWNMLSCYVMEFVLA